MDNKDDRVVDTLNNCQAYYSRCVGYCKNHGAYVTKIQIKRRQCDVKKCKYFVKTNVEYWTEKETIKELRKQKKIELSKKLLSFGK